MYRKNFEHILRDVIYNGSIKDETDGSFDFKTWRVSGLIGSMWLIKYYGSENE